MEPTSFDNREGVIWYNGAFVPWQDAKLHVLTHGLHYGSSVFEGIRSYNGKIFKLEEHTKRLLRSAQILDYSIPYSEEQINEACQQILVEQNLKDGYIRPLAWRGSEMMAIAAQKNTIHLAIAAWEWPSLFDPELKKKGIRLGLATYKRPSPETAPFASKAAGLYMICTISKHEAERKGYSDALMLDYRGLIAEATGANVFFVKNGEIHTPLADCFLDGITRRTVIDLAQKRQIKILERAIEPDELSSFEQCFLTGTAAEVTPVSEIQGHQYTVGDITMQILNDYADLVRS